jgi:hypothetical protein
MKLIAYEVGAQAAQLRPAPFERPWMDATHQQFAYRCLPLSIANAHGWEAVCPSGFSAVWRGDAATDAITIIPDPGAPAAAVSHFGHGVLTFHVPCVFRTEPGFDLMVQGPINRPKDGLYPLTGVVETDWAPFTFTMNWLFTRPGAAVRFEAGEPFCHLYPIRRELERIEPQILPLEADPDLKRQYEAWTQSRNQFNAALKQPGAAARAEKWQKNYHRGQDAFGKAAGAEVHRTRLRLKPFTRPSEAEGPVVV